MDKYAARLLLVAALLAATTFSASLFPLSGREADSEPPATVQSSIQTRSAAAPTAPTENTPVQAQSCQTAYLLSIRAPALKKGDTVTLYGTSGEELQQLSADEAGDLCAGPLPPGSYTLWHDELGTAEFALRSNAAVEARGGNCWSDGELLHLTAGRSAAVRVVCSFKKEQLPDTELCIFLKNADGTQQFEKKLQFAAYSRTQRTAFFRDVPPGTWMLYLNDCLYAELTVAQAPCSLYPCALPG